MSRPAHIAALDAAITESITRFTAADAAVKRFYAEHIVTIDTLDAGERGVLDPRATAYNDVRNCEEAIRKLGFVVLGAIGKDERGRDKSTLGDRTYSAQDDRMRARAYAAANRPEVAP